MKSNTKTINSQLILSGDSSSNEDSTIPSESTKSENEAMTPPPINGEQSIRSSIESNLINNMNHENKLYDKKTVNAKSINQHNQEKILANEEQADIFA